jgi:hypothetical protein
MSAFGNTQFTKIDNNMSNISADLLRYGKITRDTSRPDGLSRTQEIEFEGVTYQVIRYKGETIKVKRITEVL